MVIMKHEKELRMISKKIFKATFWVLNTFTVFASIDGLVAVFNGVSIDKDISIRHVVDVCGLCVALCWLFAFLFKWTYWTFFTSEKSIG